MPGTNNASQMRPYEQRPTTWGRSTNKFRAANKNEELELPLRADLGIDLDRTFIRHVTPLSATSSTANA